MRKFMKKGMAAPRNSPRRQALQDAPEAAVRQSLLRPGRKTLRQRPVPRVRGKM